MRERERAENKEEEDGWRTAGRGERWGNGLLISPSRTLTLSLTVPQVVAAGVLIEMVNVKLVTVKNGISGLKEVVVVVVVE